MLNSDLIQLVSCDIYEYQTAYFTLISSSNAGAIPYYGINSVSMFGLPSVPPVADNIFCNFNDDLLECIDNSINSGSSFCSETQRAIGLNCSGISFFRLHGFIYVLRFYCFSDFDPLSSCTEGEVRLIYQSNDHEGIVQVCFFDEWVTLCSNVFDDNDAEVICSILGFQRLGGTIKIIAFMYSHSLHLFLQLLLILFFLMIYWMDQYYSQH